jgi:hypothetical protein
MPARASVATKRAIPRGGWRHKYNTVAHAPRATFPCPGAAAVGAVMTEISWAIAACQAMVGTLPWNDPQPCPRDLWIECPNCCGVEQVHAVVLKGIAMRTIPSSVSGAALPSARQFPA